MSENTPRPGGSPANAEERRLHESRARTAHWKRWGPYLTERAWGTVREDYSPDGSAWDYFPHDHARSRAYRWNEDGLAGICDRHQQLCFALALVERARPDPERAALRPGRHEGNHGEDVKEYYFYLDSTPTHSYMKYPLQVPAGRVSLRATRRGEPATRQAASRSMSCSTRASSTRTATSMCSSSTRRRRGRHSDSHQRRQPRARGGGSYICCRRSGFATPGPGATTTAEPAAAQTVEARDDDSASLGRARHEYVLGSAGSIARARRNCSSPRTRPICSGSTASPTARLTSRTASTIRRPRQRGRRQSRQTGTKAAAHYALTIGRARRRRAPAPDGLESCRQRAGSPFGDGFRPRLRRAQRRGRRVLRHGHSADISSDDAQTRHAAGASPGCSGPSSSITTTSSDWLEGDPAQPAAARRSGETGATTTGRISTTPTSSPCPTSGSIPGMRPGTWPSTACRSRSSIRTSPKSSSS